MPGVCRPACTSSVFAAWEALLAEVEVDSQAHADVASTLGRQVSRPLIERSFFRKIQSRKVFTHRESLDTILSKTEDMLAKCRQEYKAAYLACISSPGGGALGAYLDAHNAYGAEIISTKAGDQGRRYAGLCSVCRAVSGSQDVALLARALATPACSSPQRLHNFNPPKPPQQPTPEDGSEPPPPPPPANLFLKHTTRVLVGTAGVAGRVEHGPRKLHPPCATKTRGSETRSHRPRGADQKPQ
ncbi:hypothetical protein B566_EDAN004606 [Ephemera danica]|nr:hypothetical protein B566_EDAN004606 [Ephemera danica]